MSKDFLRRCLLPIALFSLLAAANIRPVNAAQNQSDTSMGQIIYVPAYSTIFFGDKERKFDLTTTLSIRNTDMVQGITLNKIDYIGENGKLLRSYLEKPTTIGPLAVKFIVVKESDRIGGAEASFLVEWRTAKPIGNAPLIETVMIGAQSQQGISFTSRGIVIKELSE